MNPKLSRSLLPLAMVLAILAAGPAGAQAKRPLSSADIDDLAALLKLEDTRVFDEAVLTRVLQSVHPEVRRRAVVSIGRINKDAGRPLLVAARADTDVEVLASIAFATGQLRDAGAIAWLSGLLDSPRTPPSVAREAAQALGKIRTTEARAALAHYLTNARESDAAVPAIGDALLSMGRIPGKADLAPIVRWMTSGSVEIRWRAAWALFRLGDPAAMAPLQKLATDASPEVRYWAVRGLVPALVDQAGLDRPAVTSTLRAAVKDRDRRVRAEALRALLRYDDDGAYAELVAALASSDPWLATSAAEAAPRFKSRAATLTPALVAAAAPNKPVWVRHVALTPLVTLSPTAAIDVATSLAREDVAVARASAVTALGLLGDAGRERLEQLNADPKLKGLLPAPGGRGTGGGAPRPTATPRTDEDYRRIVERWIVPDYQGRPRPRAIWETARGAMEIELYPGDAPLATEYFMGAVQSGEIVGTEFGRLVPNFVAQQQQIRNAITLRDEVNRRGLTRGNLAWASSGLDTGRPGYTLAQAPHPHIEGDFTALGRVVRGLDVMDNLQWGDKITAARIK